MATIGGTNRANIAVKAQSRTQEVKADDLAKSKYVCRCDATPNSAYLLRVYDGVIVLRDCVKSICVIFEFLISRTLEWGNNLHNWLVNNLGGFQGSVLKE